MERIFINYSNHPSSRWSAAQREAAEAYGTIVDMVFPNIEPAWDAAQVASLADEAAAEIIAKKPAAVLCQGEFTYTFALIEGLRKAGITVVAACSERVVHETVDEAGVSHKTAEFSFVQFRQFV